MPCRVVSCRVFDGWNSKMWRRMFTRTTNVYVRWIDKLMLPSLSSHSERFLSFCAKSSADWIMCNLKMKLHQFWNYSQVSSSSRRCHFFAVVVNCGRTTDDSLSHFLALEERFIFSPNQFVHVPQTSSFGFGSVGKKPISRSVEN